MSLSSKFKASDPNRDLSGPPIPGYSFSVGIKLIKLDLAAAMQAQAAGFPVDLDQPPQLVVSVVIDCGGGRVAMYDFTPDELPELVERFSEFNDLFRRAQEGDTEPLLTMLGGKKVVDEEGRQIHEDVVPTPEELTRMLRPMASRLH